MKLARTPLVHVLVGLVGCAESKPHTHAVAPPSAHAVVIPAATCVDPRGASYPWRHHALSSVEIEARKNAFAARNPGAWSILTLRDSGLVFHLESADPSIVAADADHLSDFSEADLTRWSKFLRDNADFFGITDPSSAHLLLVPLGAHPAPNVAELTQYVGKTLLAEVAIGKRSGATPIIVIDGALEPIAACPHVDNDTIAMRIVGDHYIETTTWTRPAPLDCGMVPNPQKDGCAATTLVTAAAERTADRASVVVTHRIADVPRADGWFETRHFACVTLHAPPVKAAALPDDGHMRSASTLAPIGNAPQLPFAMDVVTGEVLDAAQCPRP